MDYLRNLLIRKDKNNTDINMKEKIDNLKLIFNDNALFFKLDMETAVGILDFLGIEEDKILDVYFQLISPNLYQENFKIYTTISKEK